MTKPRIYLLNGFGVGTQFPPPLYLSPLSQGCGRDSEAPPYSQSSEIQLHFVICKQTLNVQKGHVRSQTPKSATSEVFLLTSTSPKSHFPIRNHLVPMFICTSQPHSQISPNFLSHWIVIFHQEITSFSLCFLDDHRTVGSV